MQLKQYNGLIRKEKQLQENMKKFILKTLKANGGRITYTPPDTDDDKNDDDEEDDILLEEKYPLISALWGIDGIYNIAITDVYFIEYENGVVNICADGIDQDTESVKKEFTIYPEQFSNIMYFIMFPLKKKIRGYAERLALKDLVDKYDKLPHEFYTESGSIRHEFHCENRECIPKHAQAIEKLLKDASEAKTKTDKGDVHSKIMEMADALATLSLIESQGKPEEEMMVEENSCFYFTEEYQDKFNAIYDGVEAELIEFFQSV